MRISDILKGFTALHLNEAEKPRNKAEQNSRVKKDSEKPAEPKVSEKSKEESAIKQQSSDKAATSNPSAKNNSPKPSGNSRRADGGTPEQRAQRAADRKASATATTASDGVAVGDDDSAKAEIAKGASGQKGQEIKKDKASQSRKGATNHFGTETDGPEKDASDKYWNEIGTEDEEYEIRKQVSDTNRPVFSADGDNNQMHGLDNPNSPNEPRDRTNSGAQELNFGSPNAPADNGDVDGDGDFDNDDINILRDEWDADGKAGRSKPPHSPDLIDFLRGSPEENHSGLADAMDRANNLWNDNKVSPGARRSKEAIATEKELKQQKKDANSARLATGGGQKISDEEVRETQSKALEIAQDDLSEKQLAKLETEVARMAQGGATSETILGALHARLKKMRNADTPGNLARLNMSGTKRDSLDVTRNREEVNASGGLTGGDALNDLAAKAKAGDKAAAERLFKENGRRLFSIAKHYAFGDQDKQSNLYGEASEAFMKAIHEFDPANGANFGTFLQSTVKHAVRNASMADRNIKVRPEEMNKSAKYNEIKAKLENEGLSGTELDIEAAKRLGIDVKDLDSLKQNAAMSNTYSTNRPLGGEEGGEFGDVIGDKSTDTEWGGQKGSIGSQDADSDLENITAELVTGDDDTKERAFQTLVSGADLNELEAKFVRLSFGIGNNKPMTISDLNKNKIIPKTRSAKLLPEVLEKIADYIAYSNDTDYDQEYASLEKMFSSITKDYNRSQLGRSADDYIDDESMRDTKEEKKARQSAKDNSKSDRDASREKSKTDRAAKNSAMSDAMTSAKEKSEKKDEKKEPVTESERMRGFLDFMN